MKSSYIFTLIVALLFLASFGAQAQRAARGTATSTTTSTNTVVTVISNN
jgi:hypothetical protein